MNIEDAKEQLISLKENAKVNIDIDEIFRLDYEAITFVLNELDKKDKVIDMMAVINSTSLPLFVEDTIEDMHILIEKLKLLDERR